MAITHEIQRCLKPLEAFMNEIEAGVQLLASMGGKKGCGSPSKNIPKDIADIKTAVMKDIIPAFAKVPKIIHECKGLDPMVVKTLPPY
jgi:hypothetical protein